jgi:hypothetical protein
MWPGNGCLEEKPKDVIVLFIDKLKRLINEECNGGKG